MTDTEKRPIIIVNDIGVENILYWEMKGSDLLGGNLEDYDFYLQSNQDVTRPEREFTLGETYQFKIKDSPVKAVCLKETINEHTGGRVISYAFNIIK